MLQSDFNKHTAGRTIRTGECTLRSRFLASINTSASKDVINPFHCHSLTNSTLKRKLANREPILGMITGLYGDSDHVEIAALSGYDFLWADAEHSSANADRVAHLILASERRDMPTLVRIGYGYHRIIGHAQKFLVAGAQGIILPQCESVQDAEGIVKAVKFKPVGERGLAAERWNAWDLGEGGSLKQRVDTCNANSIIGVAIESEKAANEALPMILKMPEVDFIFVGPTDLSTDMGFHGQLRHPDVVKRIEELGSTIRGAEKSAGMLALNGDDYVFWRERGSNIICGIAHSMFMDGALSLRKVASTYEESRHHQTEP